MNVLKCNIEGPWPLGLAMIDQNSDLICDLLLRNRGSDDRGSSTAI